MQKDNNLVYHIVNRFILMKKMKRSVRKWLILKMCL